MSQTLWLLMLNSSPALAQSAVPQPSGAERASPESSPAVSSGPSTSPAANADSTELTPAVATSTANAASSPPSEAQSVLSASAPAAAAPPAAVQGPAPVSRTSVQAVELAEVHVTDGAITRRWGSADQGYRIQRTQLGPLGTETLQSAPFSVSGVSSEFITNTQANSTTEALKYVPTVYVNTGASQVTPYFTLRGFSASPWSYNIAVDGTRAFDIYVPLEDKEQIDVMAGPNAFLYGITSPAGVINYQLKRPTQETLTKLTLGSVDRQIWGHLDVGGHLAQAPSIGYRINALASNSAEVGPSLQNQERYLLSGAWDWQVTKHTKVTLDASRAKRQVTHTQSLFMTTAAIGIPDAPDSSKNWGAPYTGASDATTRVGVGLDSRVADLFSVRANARHTVIERAYTLGRQVWQNANHDYTWRIDSQSPFQTHVSQAALYFDKEIRTSFVKQTVTLGGAYDAYRGDNNGYHGATSTAVYNGSLDGVASHPPEALWPVGTSTAQHTNYQTLTLVDRIQVAKVVGVMLGVNYAHVDDALTSTTATGAASTANYERGRFTPAAAVSYAPIAPVTVYVSYLEGLQQGFTAASTTANAGEVFSPYVTRQLEAGVKSTLGELNLNAAAFRASSANQYVDPTTNVASQDGRAVHQGLELTTNGKLGPYVTLAGGYTYVHARIDKAVSNEGKSPQGVPEHMARAYAEVTLPPLPMVTVTGGLSYTGKVPWDAGNTLYVPGVTLVDAGARIEKSLGGVDTTFRLNVANLANNNYWTTRSGILYLGSPRTVSLSVSLSL